MRKFDGCRSSLRFTAAVALMIAAPAHSPAQVQSPAQVACASEMDKGFLKAAKATSSTFVSCLKDISKAKTSAGVCLGADRKGKIGKARTALLAAYAEGCTGAARPDIGFGGMPAVIWALDTTQLARAEALFGDDPGAAISTAADATAKCQQKVAKAVGKCFETQIKNFTSCKRAELTAGADSAAALGACFTQDAKNKVAKACDLDEGGKVDGIRKAIAKSCATPVDLIGAFPGCGTSDPGLLHACVAAPSNCNACLQAGRHGAVAGVVDCDAFDDGVANASCLDIVHENVTLPNGIEPAETPGSPGVTVTHPELIEQFGSASFSLNASHYTRWRLTGPEQQPDAVVIVIAGFGGDANNFHIMAEDLLPKLLREEGLVVELWGYHRRTDPLEDREGALLGIDAADALTTLDWYFGDDLSLTLSPILAAGPNRRANFYNTSSDIPFLANWTVHVFSRDLDAIVEAARAWAQNQNVFMAGHSAGTGFTARYAATDFDDSGLGPAEPGYGKLRGLILFEGGGGTTAGGPLAADSLDRMEDKFDGGLFAAVRDAAPRCVDGTPCTVATEAADCAGKGNGKCTEPVSAYAAVGGLTPQITAAAEAGGVQGLLDPNAGQIILQTDIGTPGNNAIDQVPGLSLLGFLGGQTVEGMLGQFLDDDGLGASLSAALATSLGAPAGGNPQRWLHIDDNLPASVFTDNGPAPTAASPAVIWGVEKEVVSMTRLGRQFIGNDTNAADWYYAASGLSVTSSLGRCSSGTCSAGNVGASCATNTDCAQSVSLDSTALSVGRNRRDIANLTQAANIDIPVICFGGSNGLTPLGASYLGFASSVGACTAPSCDGTPRVVDASNPSPAFPTYGGVNGGFEVHIREGLAHNDVVQGEEGPDTNILGPLAAFITRNVQ